MAGISTEAKVGAFMLAAFAILVFMTMQLGEFKLGGGGGYTVWAEFDDVTGLKPNSPVEMAGIVVGTVSDIQLAGTKAKVSIRLSDKVQLPSDSRIILRTRGMLGDRYLSVESGSAAAPRLKDGQRVSRVAASADLDQVMRKLGPVIEDVKAITAALRASVATEASKRNLTETLANIRELTAALKTVIADNQRNLTRIIKNMESFTRDLAQVTGSNRQDLTEIIKSFRGASVQLARSMTSLARVLEKVDSGRGTVGALVNERQTIDKINATLTSLQEVMRKINEGRGTVGRLVNDDTTVDRLEETLTGLADYLGQAEAWRVFVSYRTEFMFDEQNMRHELNVRLQPKADKFYLVGVVSDPMGRRRETSTTTTYTQGGTSWTLQEDQVSYGYDELLWNVQIGKRYRDLAVRGGLFSSTGGVALEYYLLDDALRFTTEVFDFRANERPRLRFFADYRFLGHFFVTAGVDDILSEYGNTTFFLGAGLTFHDDDLKLLLTSSSLSAR